MSSDEMVKINDDAHVSEEYDKARITALKAFDSALENNDYFEAAKAIGVLEFTGQTDIDYFSGMMYQKMALELMGNSMESYFVAIDPRVGDYLDKVIEHLSKIPENSEFHSASTACIEDVYRARGDYIELDALLKERGTSISPIEELSKRIECLKSLALIDPLDETAFPAEISTRAIDSIDESATQQLSKFQVFASFAATLTMAAECVFQCAEYAENTSNCGMKFAEYQETSAFASLYEKCVCVLRCSALFNEALLPEAMGDLPHLALSDCDWGQRVKRYGDEWWTENLARTCWQLCAPETHPQVDSYQCVENILQSYMSLGRFDLGSIINRYFAIVVDAAERGSQSARGYLGFTYSMIKVDGDDPYNMEEKLERYAHDSGEGFSNVVAQHAKLSTALSRHSFNALVNAECALMLHESAELAVRDASHIALMFFRVLEFEYSANLVHPLIGAIDFDRLEETTGYIEHSKRRRGDRPIASRFDRWLRGLDSVYAVKTGFKKAMEIGVLRTFLAHILHRNDPCASLLEEALESVLTDEGLEAYHSEKLMDVIGKTQVDEYRIPGAHTGFVTLTKAKEARDYVTSWAPIIVTWFKAAGHEE